MEAFFLVEPTYLALAIPCFRDEFAADSPLQRRVINEPSGCFPPGIFFKGGLKRETPPELAMPRHPVMRRCFISALAR